MTGLKKSLLGMAASIAMLSGVNPAHALDEITVAYFLEWPIGK